jgi:hypothetical protein
MTENLLRTRTPYKQWKYEQLKKFAARGHLLKPSEYHPSQQTNKLIILVHGNATPAGEAEKEIRAPAILEHGSYAFSSGALLFLC